MANPDFEELKRILWDTKTIAVVGLSPDPSHDSYGVASYLKSQGYRIIPVNPNAEEILGETAYPSLQDVPEPIDVVDIFRKIEAVPDIVEDAIAIGAKVVWMQLGIEHPVAAKRARGAGLQVVMNACMRVTHRMLISAGWDAYYERHKDREPVAMLLDVLERFEAEGGDPNQRQAIDLGCGQGTETLALLRAGWQVLAVDNQPGAIQHLRAALPDEHRSRLEIRLASFDELELPESDLIWAGYSLPFCRPQKFDRLWSDISSSIRPGGRFAGQLFGINDSWASEPEMNFHSAEGVAELLARDFEVELLDEREEDGGSGAGPKHWHVFDIIARRRS